MRPLSIGLFATLFSLIFSGIGFVQAQLVNGNFCYALDDSFIMMAISRNLADHGVWGLTRWEFSSTASSPLFTLLLAGTDLLFGEKVWMPLVLNILALGGLFVWMAFKARNWGFNRWQTWFLLMGLFYFMPVPVLLFGGMEHILHTWIALFFLELLLRTEGKTPLVLLFFTGAALAGIRYEGLFEGGLAVLWLWQKKEWTRGLVLGLGMALPVLALGIYSMAQGWFFLPNSLVLKGYSMNIQETGNFFGFILSWLSKAGSNPHAIAALLILYFTLTWQGSRKGDLSLWLGFAFWIGILHFVFARYNHVYRYEAYLMALTWVAFWKTLCQTGVLSDTASLLANLKENPGQTILYGLLAFSPLYRSVDSYAVGTRAMVNIYEQQVQCARFVEESYNQSVVGALDVGAIAYYSDSRLLDLWGLADLDIAWLKLKGKYVPEEIHQVTRKKGMEMAIGYGNNMGHPEWQRMESWVIRNNAVCSRDTVDFYAFTPENREKLRQNLNRFHPRLPRTVEVISYSSPTP